MFTRVNYCRIECYNNYLYYQLRRFEVQTIDKPIIGTTKKDLLDNVSGKFALLFSSPIVVDEDVIDAAGKCYHKNIIANDFLNSVGYNIKLDIVR